MSDASSALLGAAVGGLASLFGTLVVVGFNWRDRVHADRTRVVEDHRTRVQDQLADVIRLTFAIEYRVFELSWTATHHPQRIDADFVSSYERETSLLLPKYSGALVVLGGLAPEVQDVVKPWAEQVDAFDGKAARALIGLPSSESLERLRELYEPLIEFFRTADDRLAPAFATLRVAHNRPDSR